MFAGIGIALIYRLIRERHELSEDNMDCPKQSLISCPITVILFGFWMIFGGIVCCWLDNNWYLSMNIPKRILFYSGIAIPFVILFAFLLSNLITFILLNFTANNLKPVIETTHQFALLIVTAVFMGVLYGLIFGIIDCNSIPSCTKALQLMLEDSYPFTVGLILGFLEGFINEIIRENGGYLRIKVSRFDDYFD